jgi:hypothetical protein
MYGVLDGMHTIVHRYDLDVGVHDTSIDREYATIHAPVPDVPCDDTRIRTEEPIIANQVGRALVELNAIGHMVVGRRARPPSALLLNIVQSMRRMTTVDGNQDDCYRNQSYFPLWRHFAI